MFNRAFPEIPKDFKPTLMPGAPAWMIRPCGHIEEDFYPDQRHGWKCRDCVLWHPRRVVRDGALTGAYRKN